MDNSQAIEAAKQHFGTVLEQQLARVERLKEEGDWVDYSTLSPIIIGMLGGDGIGPTISDETQKVLEYLLRDRGCGRQGPIQGHRRAHHREPRREDAVHP